MKLYGEARTDPQLRCKGMKPPTHTPDPDDLRELCGLAACLRAWASTPGDQPDAGREHALYPPKQYRPGLGSDEGPLWSAIECVLARHGFGKEHF
jgi:hypothetical protein